MRRFLPIIFIVGCAILAVIGLFLYNRPQPVTPSPQATGEATPTQSPVLQAHNNNWGERFKNAQLPNIPDVTWQTYTDTEHGFTFQFPAVWEIQKNTYKTSGVTSLTFCSGKFEELKVQGKDCRVLLFSLRRGNLQEVILANDSEWAERIRTKGFVPDANINGIDIYITHPELNGDNNGDNTIIQLYFEKNGTIYSFAETFEGASEQNNTIIEYIIKSFHFVK